MVVTVLLSRRATRSRPPRPEMDVGQAICVVEANAVNFSLSRRTASRDLCHFVRRESGKSR